MADSTTPSSDDAPLQQSSPPKKEIFPKEPTTICGIKQRVDLQTQTSARLWMDTYLALLRRVRAVLSHYPAMWLGTVYALATNLNFTAGPVSARASVARKMCGECGGVF